MIIDRFEVEVCPKISAKCLTDIESWLLFRAFRTDRKNGYIGFSGCWSLNEICERLILPDKELYKALFTSRQVCPELCAEVEHLIREVGFIMRNFVNYERIFQAIIRRHPNFLDQVSITRGFMHLRPSVTLITKPCTRSGSIRRRYENDQNTSADAECSCFSASPRCGIGINGPTLQHLPT